MGRDSLCRPIQGSTHVKAGTRCRIYAVIEAGPHALARLEAALAASNLAALLIAPADGSPVEAAAAKPLIEAAQRADVAALIADDARLARELDADGVHLNATAHIADRHASARATMGARAIVGVDVGLSRHDAMSVAEGGADYIAFGAPPTLSDRARGRARRNELIAWWAEIFEVPCVAFDVESAGEAAALCAAGADFIAVAHSATGSPAGLSALLSEINAAIGIHAGTG